MNKRKELWQTPWGMGPFDWDLVGDCHSLQLCSFILLCLSVEGLHLSCGRPVVGAVRRTHESAPSPPVRLPSVAVPPPSPSTHTNPVSFAVGGWVKLPAAVFFSVPPNEGE
jgi:hypothetical protein